MRLYWDTRLVSSPGVASLFLALFRFAARCFDRIQPDCLTHRVPGTRASTVSNQDQLKFRRVGLPEERQERLGILPPCDTMLSGNASAGGLVRVFADASVFRESTYGARLSSC